MSDEPRRPYSAYPECEHGSPWMTCRVNSCPASIAADNKRKALAIAGQAGIELAVAWERFMDAVRRLEETNRALKKGSSS